MKKRLCMKRNFSGCDMAYKVHVLIRIFSQVKLHVILVRMKRIQSKMKMTQQAITK